MNLNVIKIGNSKGIRFPSYILKECNIYDVVNLYVKEGKIIIEPIMNTRKNWNQEFIRMHQKNDDTLIIDDSLDMNLEEWEW